MRPKIVKTIVAATTAAKHTPVRGQLQVGIGSLLGSGKAHTPTNMMGNEIFQSRTGKPITWRDSRVFLPALTDSVFSGPAEVALRQHAYGRAKHFFIFEAFMRIGCLYLYEKQSNGNAEAIKSGSQDAELTQKKKEIYEKSQHLSLMNALTNSVTNKATLQRGKGSKYSPSIGNSQPTSDRFDIHAKDIADRRITGETETHAAHYNNLGINHSFMRAANNYLLTSPNDIFFKNLFRTCQEMCADTGILPRAVNSDGGPETIMDQLHIGLHKIFINNLSSATDIGAVSRIISMENIDQYVAMGIAKIEAWKLKDNQKKTQVWRLGDAYISGLNDVRANLQSEIERSVEYLIKDKLDDKNYTLGYSYQEILSKYILNYDRSKNEAPEKIRTDRVQKEIDKFQAQRRINLGQLLTSSGADIDEPD
ncbi:hypothetical protein ACTACL_21850 [Pseudomonas syringae]|uniref:hypothetical protein n=1 Tax=Pseudomonas syringae TaxID=317 RepID=UPI003F7AC472